ncbi:MAG: hypothetical protein HPY71_07605 [Firmicutes bacterium]|nr:hypothetical protein [Bacillota bacterium]
MKAGVAKAVITPYVGIALEGNVRDKGSQGIHDDLYVRALVLQADDGTELGIIASDLVGVPQDFCDGVRAMVEAETGIPRGNVMVTASHTHSGPAMLGLFGIEVDQGYTEVLKRKFAGAAKMARNRLREAQVRFAVGEEASVAFNRRIRMKDGTLRMNWEFIDCDESLRRGIAGPAGPVDPEIAIMEVRGAGGEPLCVFFNYALHPAILAGDNFDISADYPGYSMRLIEAVTGAVAMYTNGADGNVNHINVNDPEQGRGFGEAERVGTIVGAEVIKALARTRKASRPVPSGQTGSIAPAAGAAGPAMHTPLACTSKVIDVPRRRLSSAEVEAARKVAGGKTFQELSKLLALVDGVPDEIYALEILELAALREKDPCAHLELQAFRVGDAAFVAVPGELFVEFGLEIKARSPLKPTFVVGYANGYEGYIPTEKAFSEGGYEPRTARTSQLAEEAGRLITEAAVELLGDLAGR